MTLRRVDARFLLPEPPRSATVLPGAEAWREPLERAGVSVGTEGDADLVVAGPEGTRQAAALHPRMLILEGRARRDGARYLPLPRLEEPTVFVPLGGGAPARYAVEQWAFAGTLRHRVRNRAVAGLAARGLLPPFRPEVLVSAPPGLPFVVRPALELGVPADIRPLLLAGQGDEYSRAAFLLFEPGAQQPGWALKFARLPVRLSAFERERAGLALARSVGGAVAAHAPRWLGAFEADGLQCTLETAARGKPLLALLRISSSEQAVELVCDWLLEVARATRAAPETLGSERHRLSELDPGVVDELPPVPAVLQHNDVGSWNVLVDGDGFTVLDWEDAVAHGLPLWDLLYFLADAAAELDGATGASRVDHFERLFLGEARSSPLLFRWIRAQVEELEIPPDAVGAIATLCWLHHGRSGEARAEGTSDPDAGKHAAFAVLEQIAGRWLKHPRLGTGWSAWR